MKRKNLLKKFCIITFIVVSALIMYTNGTVYSTVEKLSATDYTGKIPSYYQEIGALSNGLKVYSFENVRGSSGGTPLYIEYLMEPIYTRPLILMNTNLLHSLLKKLL